MTLRAPDIKDEHGWQILREDGTLHGHATSRDVARHFVRGGFPPSLLEKVTMLQPTVLPVHSNGSADTVEVLPADNSPEAVAARHAWNVHSKLRETTRAQQMIWVMQATYLYEIWDQEHWKTLDFESFDAYLSDPDTDIEIRWGRNLVAIYKTYVIGQGVDPEDLKELEVSKVTEALPAVRRKQVPMDELLSDIKTLTKSALKLKLSGKASKSKGTPESGSEINTEGEPEWAQCPSCGSRYRVDGEGRRVDG